MSSNSNHQAGASAEVQTENEKILEAIKATLLNRATTDQSSYAIGTRRLDRIPVPELLQLQRTYTTAVRLERNRAFGTIKLKC